MFIFIFYTSLSVVPVIQSKGNFVSCVHLCERFVKSVKGFYLQHVFEALRFVLHYEHIFLAPNAMTNQKCLVSQRCI